MCVCVYVYVYVCICIYIYTPCVCVCVFMYMHMYVYVYICIYIHLRSWIPGESKHFGLTRRLDRLLTTCPLSKPGGGNVTDRESNLRPLGVSYGDITTHLKRSAVMSGTGIHRLIYRDICVERGASYAACAAHNNAKYRFFCICIDV